ncbi:hypothetical protein XMM379_001831 [Aliiroseovarius sp. xm-m-379]|uniref:Uncharacterized protein n=1 Tax=Aliiroseovarius crassostreae TaxID=154981 RepID=A0A0P7IU91_9RHOB|nr:MULTISPECIES: DUF6477 family protein [Aliiroseovarius]KPN62447.1 hypothetical protein AKJ29_09495 [Aliiroseovarius crassostreae]NRP11916.1 hypothetical protein [Aliiroseovarius sp. xm-d-517]NRP25139.1 hypothetical protein [Aliiroseovarius sp. xm-m-379]NRP31128.1 hypothetical protein [Aliiroseovarius sp. xm-m-314]NRP33938.1 hypothetical protein [Aliiroseovarius sp. xm-a-104]
MTDALDLLKSLRRPRLLIRAARFGMIDYNRDRDLKRLMKSPRTPSPASAVDGLIVEEARLEATRQAGDASYSVGRHVEVLIALMAEARLLPRKLKGV